VLLTGRTRLFIVVWMMLHLIGFAFAMVNYGLKDNLNNARSTFGFSYGSLPSSIRIGAHSIVVLARGAAQVLHIDVVFILFPVCRNFINLLRRTPLNDIIPFDKNVEFHSKFSQHAVTSLSIDVSCRTGWMGDRIFQLGTHYRAYAQFRESLRSPARMLS